MTMYLSWFVSFLTAVVFVQSCNKSSRGADQLQETPLSIVYEAQTRGFYKKVTYKNEHVSIVTLDSDEVMYKLLPEQVNFLNQWIKETDFDAIKDYDSPKIHVDAKIMASLEVITASDTLFLGIDYDSPNHYLLPALDIILQNPY